ncbi:peptide/nickel transport system permease protein [Halogranum amylolyticum]|uniref:Peptide/nickel transport system permease protein n=1 Tax=Halogranum amylolyticum TaxID=660520 RepID=A0A1H8MRA8_9EURY|nr:ABC transporter permease [Halogranum amylolyticum]SEO19763.1 peptide/nickel transport system permease protein [Halogranum amylolyticum]
MYDYFVKRTLQALFTTFVVVSLSFGLVRLMPGNPADQLRGQLIRNNPSLSQQEINRRVANYINVDFSAPLHEQYLDYVLGVLQGDLGQSISQNAPVAEVLGGALPWTIFAFSVAILLMFVVGISLGSIMAYWEGSRFDMGTTGLGIVLNSTPNYVTGLLFLYIFGFTLGWFPTSGHISSAVVPIVDPLKPVATFQFVADAIYHASLLIGAVVITGFGGVALAMRGNSIQVLGEDYLRVARLRGLSDTRIALRYVARNAILPMYTGLLLAFGGVIGGSAILEQVFTYPGLGYYIVAAVEARDYPLMMGGFILITLAVVVGAFIADLTYGLVDPRVSTGGDSA